MQQWVVNIDGGPRRVNHAAAAIGKFIFSFGGYCTGENFEIQKPMRVFVLNTVNFRWKEVLVSNFVDLPEDDVPYERYGHSAVSWNDCAYVWGGRNDKSGACNTLYCFNPVCRGWSRPMVTGIKPGARDGHSACVIDNRMFVFGGFEEQAEQFSNDVHALDFLTLNWQLIINKGKTMPAKWRDFHTATALGSHMYIFGGRSDQAGPYHTNNELYCNKLMVFDTMTRCWSTPNAQGMPPGGRRSHSAFIYRNELYIFGGYNGVSHAHFCDLYKFNPVNNIWSEVKVRGWGPCKRRRQCCCVIGERVYIFGGTSPSKTFDDDMSLANLTDLSDP